jgi:predicted Zn-dependent protease
VTRLDPSNGLFVGRLAALQFDAGDAAATLATARKMQGLPNGTFAALQQGLLFEAMARYSLGEEEQAAAGMRKLLALNPQSSFAWLMLASIEALHGREAESAAALKRYLALAPAGQSIQRLRANETVVKNEQFKQQRERYYMGLRRAGLPD